MKPLLEEVEVIRYRDDLSLSAGHLKTGATDSLRIKRRAGAVNSLGSIFNSKKEEFLTFEKDYSHLDLGNEQLDHFVESTSLEEFKSFLRSKRRGSRLRDHIITRSDGKGWTLLHITANAHRFDLFLHLLKSGGEPQHLNNSGVSPLHMLAATKPSSEAYCTLLSEAITLTVDSGVDVNIRNPTTGATPLHKAVYKCSLIAAAILLQCGASVDVQEFEKQESPLCSAVRCQSEEFVRFLMYHYPSKENQQAALKISTSLQLHQMTEILQTVGSSLAEISFNDNLKGQGLLPCKNVFDLFEFIYHKGDKELTSAFFLSYHHFTTPILLLDQLRILSTKLRTRLWIFLKTWVSLCFSCDFKAESDGIDILQYVSEFSLQSLDSCKADKDSLLEVIHKERSARKYHMQWAELQKRITKVQKADFDPNPYYDNVAGYSKPLLDVRSKIITDYLFLIDCHNFSKLLPTEFHNMNWDKEPSKAQNLIKSIQRSNHITLWVVTTITMAANHQDASNILKKFIDVTAELQAMNDFEGMFSVFCGLQNTFVQKLKDLWEGLPTKQKESWNKISNLWNPTCNFKAYRQTVQELQKQGSFYIPALFLFLKDVTFTLDGNSWWIEGFLNSSKIQMFGSLLLNNLINIQKKIPLFVESNDLKFTDEQSDYLLLYLMHVNKLSLSNEMIIKLAPISHVPKSKTWKMQEPSLVPPPSPRIFNSAPTYNSQPLDDTSPTSNPSSPSTSSYSSLTSYSSSSSISSSSSSSSASASSSPILTKHKPTPSTKKKHLSMTAAASTALTKKTVDVKATLASDSTEIVCIEDILKEAPKRKGGSVIKRSSSGGSSSAASIETKPVVPAKTVDTEVVTYRHRPRRNTISAVLDPMIPTAIQNELKQAQSQEEVVAPLPVKQTHQPQPQPQPQQAKKRLSDEEPPEEGRPRSRSVGAEKELSRF